MAASTKVEAEAMSRKLVNRWSAGSTAAGFIPGAGLVLTAGDFVLAKNIASIFGVEEASAESTMAALAGSLFGRAASTILSFVPFVNGVVAGATTKALGEAVISHYKHLSSLP